MSSLPEAKKVIIKILTGCTTWSPTNQNECWQSRSEVWASTSSPGPIVPYLLPCSHYIPSLEFQTTSRELHGACSHCDKGSRILSRSPRSSCPWFGSWQSLRQACSFWYGSYTWLFITQKHSTAWLQYHPSPGLRWRLSPICPIQLHLPPSPWLQSYPWMQDLNYPVALKEACPILPPLYPSCPPHPCQTRSQPPSSLSLPKF